MSVVEFRLAVFGKVVYSDPLNPDCVHMGNAKALMGQRRVCAFRTECAAGGRGRIVEVLEGAKEFL